MCTVQLELSFNYYEMVRTKYCLFVLEAVKSLALPFFSTFSTTFSVFTRVFIWSASTTRMCSSLCVRVVLCVYMCVVYVCVCVCSLPVLQHLSLLVSWFREKSLKRLGFSSLAVFFLLCSYTYEKRAQMRRRSDGRIDDLRDATLAVSGEKLRPEVNRDIR